jgi:HSP20 family protein
MGSQNAWDPLKDLVQVQQRMNNLFESALARTDFDTAAGLDSWAPVADVHEAQERLYLCLELPGFEQSEIDLKVDGDHLIVEGERRMDADANRGQFHRVERAYGKFSRRFPLPSRFDRDCIQATYRNGVLKISLPARNSLGPESFSIDIG